MALIGLVTPTAVARQASEPGVAKVAGSWYRPNPTCQLVVGCVDLPIPSTYPAGTIHVGVLAGVEESRAFVAIDIPQGKKLVAGTLTLPVAPPQDGSLAPETARLQACLATGMFKEEDRGVSTQSPTPLCVFSSPVELVEDEDPAATLQPTMTVDLKPFLATWGTEQTGIVAILPVNDVGPTDIWHVAFSTPDRESALPTEGTEGAEALEAQPISATFELGGSVTPPKDDNEPDTGGNEPPPVDTGSTGNMSGGTNFPSTGAPVVEAPELGPAPVGDSGTNEVPVATAAPLPVSGPIALVGYAYPGVYLVPLLFALAMVWAGRAFTVDLATRGRR